VGDATDEKAPHHPSILKADVIFVNNEVFKSEIKIALENIFCNLKNGSQVISIEPFCNSKRQESSLKRRKGLHAT